jgi:PPOX class probable F420-dependent enzyme
VGEGPSADRQESGMATFPESHRDLLESQVATLATIDADGFPQLTEVWFAVDGEDVKISLNSSRRKTRNLTQRSQCSLLLLDLANPYRYLEIRARAQVEPDDDYAFAQKVGSKYHADLREHDRPGEHRVVVTLVPTKIHAVDMGA